MFLCFFSLTASMTANIYEQTKEIAVLRAIGFTKRRVIMLYIYEAFLLVFSSSIIGICIGVLVGWTMMLQRVLFTQIPLVFYIPYAEIISIFVVSIICSFLSTFGPARAVVKRKIAQIFRMN
jgi:ABC-type antimicrobial peptide transport system permease subunit